jgi:hypothetical protein
MGTSYKPEAPVRELTKTEIDIAVAQIVDRLTRVIRFANDVAKELEDSEDETLDESKAFTVFAEKHGIPEGVHPCPWERPQIHKIKDISKHVRKWVKGELSPADCDALHADAMEWGEYDIGFVFLGQPSFYYDEARCVDVSEVAKKFTSVGSRNYNGKVDVMTISFATMGGVFS